MIIKNIYEVIDFIKSLPVEIKEKFLVLFKDHYTCEYLSWEDIVDIFVFDNYDELIELGYLVEFD